VLKHLSYALVRLGRALEVLLGTNLLANILGLFWSHGLLGGLVKLLNCLLVEAQVLFATDQDNGETLAEVQNLGNPLLLDVVKGIRRVDSKANQNDVGVGIGKRSQTIVIFLTCGIPQSELDVLAIDLDVGDVVLKDGGDVDLGEGTLGEDNEKTGLSTGAVAYDNELSANLSHGGSFRRMERESKVDIRVESW